MKKLFIYLIFTLFIILAFFTDLHIPLFAHKTAQVALVLSIISFCLIIIFYYKSALKDIKQLILNKSSSFKHYLYFISYVFIITLIYCLIGKTSFVSYIDIIGQYFIIFMFCYLVIFFLTKRVFGPYKMIKFIYSTIYIILILGIVDFFAYKYNISFLQSFMQYFQNTSTLVVGGDVFRKSIAFGAYRVQSIYFEPGYYAEHLFLLAPLIYYITNTKNKIYKSSRLNIFVKKTFIPLFWLNLLLTQSPMWISFSLILFIFLHYKYIKKYISILIVSIILFITFIFINNITIDIHNSFLSRITTVLSNIYNINSLIEMEQSLGTRLSCIINLIDIGLREPIFGVGHSNIKPLMIEQIKNNNSKVFVTREMYYCILIKERPSFQNPAIVNMFVRYGILGLFLYLVFLYKLQINLRKLSKITIYKYDKAILKSFYSMFICIMIIQMYDIAIADYVCHFIIGISMGLEQYYIKNRRFNEQNS